MVVLTVSQALKKIHPIDLELAEGLRVEQGEEVSKEVVVVQTEAIELKGEGLGSQVFDKGLH